MVDGGRSLDTLSRQPRLASQSLNKLSVVDWKEFQEVVNSRRLGFEARDCSET